MLKLLLKLAVVALLANGVYHVGAEYLTYIKFRDAVRDAAIFKAKDNAELLARMMSLAEQYDVPLSEENVSIERGGQKVSVIGWYDKPIEVLPNYPYPWHFGLSVEVVSQVPPGSPAWK